MTSSEATIILPFKYAWNDQECFQKLTKRETIESPLFGPENFDLIKFKLCLNYQTGFEYSIDLILVSSMVPTLNLKYKIILNLTEGMPIEFEQDEALSVGKECGMDFSCTHNFKSIQCDFELNFPYKFEPQLKTLTKDLNLLRLNNRFTDVTFVVGKKEFSTNKNILSARSPVFEVMFRQEKFIENQENRVDITDIDEKVFGALLDFIYTAQVEQFDEIAPELLVAAHKYDIKSLVEMCAQSMICTMSIENAVNYLLHANMYSLAELKSKAIDFINRNAGKITKSEDWTKHVQVDHSLKVELYRDLVDKLPQT